MRLIALLLLLLQATGCNLRVEKPLHKILHLNFKADPTSLDPRLVQTLADLTLMRQLYDGLYRMDEQGPQPALAQNVILSDDGLTYTFNLRPAQWTNGQAITAMDFIRSWSETLTPSFACPYAYMLFPIKNAIQVKAGKSSIDSLGLKALDELTLQVELEKPTPYFLELTAFPTLFPVHEKSAQEKLPISSGPFQLAMFHPGDTIQLVKNKRYWDQVHVYLDGIEFSLITDNQTEGYLFEKGKLHWLGQPISNNIEPTLMSQLRVEGKIYSYDVDGTFWFKINTEAAPFHNKMMRHAFALALDRQTIITHLLCGGQKPATSILPPSLALSHTPFFQDGDSKMAKLLFEQALDEEGWTRDSLPTITLKYPPTERNTKLVSLVQEQWQKTFGISVQLEAIENTVYRQITRQGNYQIGTGEWVADFHDPVAFLEIFKEKNIDGVGVNDTNWHDEDYTAILEASASEQDPEIRFALLKSAEQILMQQMPVIPMYHYAFDYSKKEDIQDIVLSPLGTMDFKSACIR